ncbi:DUF1906 domain-containing protein [Flexibacterium corallicola]|uniref:DUF1906 domain-containing protein n=1 Tax=Flexibacterium corallicola TaxID=3037259 RepID=UPI00286F6A3B|nr:DUF1906 domain-containing protein [Pseudovibrio sp. M1P-2-3]
MSNNSEYAVDTAGNAVPSISALKQYNVVAVGRYLSLSAWKRLSEGEAQQLLDAGLSLFTVYEDANNAASCFTSALGEKDAKVAIDQAQNMIGQPYGSGIYFAVDYDASQEDYESHIKPYFVAVNQVFRSQGNPFIVGAYGSGLICSNLLSDNLTKYTWLSMSKGFSGYSEFLGSGQWNLSQQYCQESQSFDTDLINPEKPNFGAFDRITMPAAQ